MSQNQPGEKRRALSNREDTRKNKTKQQNTNPSQIPIYALCQCCVSQKAPVPGFRVWVLSEGASGLEVLRSQARGNFSEMRFI